MNYRSAALLKDAIGSFRSHNAALAYEIIIVDNHSGDNSRELITTEFPDITWIQLNDNAGFARANNKGMELAKGDCFLLLNPDTICTDDSVTRCYHKLKSGDHIAAGVQLFDAQQQPQISGSQFMEGGINHLLPLPYWGDFLRWLGYSFGTKAPGVSNASAITEVDWISGAFLMVKREAVSSAGMMDEDFFLYAEEVEWCSRLRKTGRLCIYGDLQIIHLEGGSINKEHNAPEKGYYNLFDKKGLQLMVSNHVRVRKQYGVGWFLFLLMNYTWGVVCFWACSTLHRLFTLRNPFGDWQKVASFGSNVRRLWSLAPTIISGKPYFYKMF